MIRVVWVLDYFKFKPVSHFGPKFSASEAAGTKLLPHICQELIVHVIKKSNHISCDHDNYCRNLPSWETCTHDYANLSIDYAVVDAGGCLSRQTRHLLFTPPFGKLAHLLVKRISCEMELFRFQLCSIAYGEKLRIITIGECDRQWFDEHYWP